MKIEVELFGFLADYGPEGKGEFQVNLDGEATVGQLMERIACPSDVPLLVLVNGQRVEASCPLKEGDEVFIFSPVAGG
jgi:molybdopterin converting factor small subunit